MNDKKQVAFEWFGWTPEQRFARRLLMNKKELAEHLGVSYPTLLDWERQWKKMIAEPQKEVEPIPPKGEITEEEIMQYKRLLFELANNKESSAKIKELCAKMLGILIERQEQKVIHLDGSYLAGELIRAKHELESAGMAQVPIESAVSSREVLLPSGQGEEDNNQV